jgi:hypothetical protein
MILSLAPTQRRSHDSALQQQCRFAVHVAEARKYEKSYALPDASNFRAVDFNEREASRLIGQ